MNFPVHSDLVTSSWCNENAAQCGSCSGQFCSPLVEEPPPVVLPPPNPLPMPESPTGVCYNAACGCPDNGDAPNWCTTQTTWPEIVGQWCNENAAHCEGSCNGKYCPTLTLSFLQSQQLP